MVRHHHSFLCHSLFKLVSEKLRTDLEQLQEDDVLLGHVIDEIILFERDVTELEFDKFVPPENMPITVIEEEPIFHK